MANTEYTVDNTAYTLVMGDGVSNAVIQNVSGSPLRLVFDGVLPANTAGNYLVLAAGEGFAVAGGVPSGNAYALGGANYPQKVVVAEE